MYSSSKKAFVLVPLQVTFPKKKNPFCSLRGTWTSDVFIWFILKLLSKLLPGNCIKFCASSVEIVLISIPLNL